MTLAVSVLSTPRHVGDAVAAVLLQAMADRRDAHPTVIGWPVGRSPRPIVEALVAAADRLDLHDVVVALMDDYVTGSDQQGWQRIPESLPHSCLGAAHRELVAPLHDVLPPARRMPRHNLWSPDPADPAGYEGRIADAGGVDVFVVALGATDGHVALNPPGTPADSRTRIVRIAESTRRDNLSTFPALDTLDDVPGHGVTVGLATITAARRLAVIAHGADKQAVVERLRAGGRVDAAWPMTAVLTHPDAHLYCDRAAAGLPELVPSGSESP